MLAKLEALLRQNKLDYYVPHICGPDIERAIHEIANDIYSAHYDAWLNGIRSWYGDWLTGGYVHGP